MSASADLAPRRAWPGRFVGDVAIASAALIVAALIYLSAREGLRLHQWAAALGLDPGVCPSSLELPELVRYVLPDALWQLAFCLVVFGLWRDARRTPWMWACVALPVVIGVGSELAQGLGLIEGVFDMLDLSAMMLATLLAWVMTRDQVRQ